MLQQALYLDSLQLLLAIDVYSISVMDTLHTHAEEHTYPSTAFTHRSMEGIRNVVFDFGGVLIDWNPRYFFRNYFHDDERMEYFLSHVCSPEWNEKQDAGRSIAEAVAEAKSLHPEFSDAIECYYGHFAESLGGPIEKNVQRLKDYKAQGFRLYGLTNWPAETFHYALERFDFLSLLDGIVVSGVEKVKKPDSRIYQILLTRYSLNPAECLFLDDREENLRAAALQGMQVELIV